ncbi:hypothetical protein HGRIS_009134 [Hohenbuehelia grisea]|uniref:Uncharacterized protein n=1 Tax=Hohenbuehelia grisea TaxID=104357 RepID=A0ABR3J0F2_9AGAR
MDNLRLAAPTTLTIVTTLPDNTSAQETGTPSEATTGPHTQGSSSSEITMTASDSISLAIETLTLLPSIRGSTTMAPDSIPSQSRSPDSRAATERAVKPFPEGITVGISIFLTILVFSAIFFFFWRKRRRRHHILLLERKYLPPAQLEADLASIDTKVEGSYFGYKEFHEKRQSGWSWKSREGERRTEQVAGEDSGRESWGSAQTLTGTVQHAQGPSPRAATYDIEAATCLSVSEKSPRSEHRLGHIQRAQSIDIGDLRAAGHDPVYDDDVSTAIAARHDEVSTTGADSIICTGPQLVHPVLALPPAEWARRFWEGRD